MIEVFYECSDGTKINFTSDVISVDNPEALVGNAWEYSSIAGSGGLSRIKRFFKDAQETELTLEILADDADQYNDIMEQMHRCFERDIRTMEPGRLWWGDFYKECYIVESKYDEFEELLEYVEKKITIVSVSPFWTKISTHHFYAREEQAGTLDYPFDYGSGSGGYDFDAPGQAEYFRNDSIYDANFAIVFYGPASNPQVVIGGHSYTLYTTLTAGERAEINSRTKKITKYTVNGTEENVFHTRDKENYIFKKIPSGYLSVNKADALALDIVIYDERGEPTWI